MMKTHSGFEVDGDLRAPSIAVVRKTRPEVAFHLKALCGFWRAGALARQFVLLALGALVLASTASARVVGKLYAMTQATVKIEVTDGPVIYIDPTGINTTPADADIILLTHNHGDHQSTAVMTRLRKAGTVFVSSPAGVPALQTAFAGATIHSVIPGQKLTLSGIEIETVPMYNVVKNNHPRVMNFVGYVVNVGGVRVYHAGDTERFPEMKTFTCDVAMLPLGQVFTMNSVQEAVDAALDVQARIAIPIHWGNAEGTLADANFFVAQLSGRMQAMVNTPATGFMLERPDPITIAEHPASQTVAPGGTATFRVLASGSGSAVYRWYRNGQPLAATNAILTIPAVTAADAGDYTVLVTDSELSSVTSRMARLVVDTPVAGRLVNLSVRAVARGVNAPLIVGCIVEGGGKPMLVRGIGPTLAGFGVAGTLIDPRLEVHGEIDSRDTVLASNNDWATGGVATLRAAFDSVGAFDLPDIASRDAALIATIDGSRSVHVADTGDRSGVALVEIYDLPPAGAARLVNLSARNFAGTGGNTLIAGFVIDGNMPKRLLIRGVGPQLGLFGVTGTLTDPKLDLYIKDGDRDVLFATNDNWSEGGATPARAAFTSAGAFDLPDAASQDAALVVTVPAGAFSAQVSGIGSATGEALVEIYELP